MTLVPAPTAADSLDLAPQAFRLAQQIARTDFVPTALRGQPEAVLACILTGYEVGIGPLQSLAKIHVIEGRPAMAAELMRALALRAGHEIWIEESNTTRCVIAGCRAGSSRETRITWTKDDAKRAGLDGRNNWRKYPTAMLLARASAQLCRAIFPEVLAGISYTIEELEDGDVLETEAVDDGTPTRAPKQAPGRTRKATKSIAAKSTPVDAPTAPSPAAEVPPLPGEEGYEGPDQPLPADAKRQLSWGQRAAMRAGEVGVSDEDRHLIYKTVSDGRTDHGDDLTEAEQHIAAAAILRLGRGEDHDEVLDRVRLAGEALRSGDAGPGTADPGSLEGALPQGEDEWRRELRRRNVKVAVLIRQAQLVGGLR